MNPKALDSSDAPKKVKYYIVISYKDEEFISVVKEDYEYNIKELEYKLSGGATDSFTMECNTFGALESQTTIFRKNILDNSVIMIRYMK